jgi:CBS domain-containing protein
MTRTVREVMTPDATCIGENETVAEAARRLAALNIGSMPICGEDGKLKGMLTDRDIVIKVVAKGADPGAVTAGSLAEGKPVTIGADDSLEEAERTMSEHQVRRLPVIDGHQLVGMLSQADLALNAEEGETGEVVRAISKE